MTQVALIATIAIFAGVVGSVPASAAGSCASKPAPQSDSTRPALKGRMLFQSSSGVLYLTNFATGTTAPLTFSTSAAPGTPFPVTPSNASFSADGRWILFYGLWTPAGQAARNDVFIAASNGSKLVNLTGDQSGATPYEDPSFAPGGTTILFKQIFYPSGQPAASSIMSMVVNLPPPAGGDPSRVGGLSTLVDDGHTEFSKPTLSPTGKYLYFFTGTSPNEAVARQDTQTGVVTSISASPGVNAYYPVPRDLTTTLFTAWRSATATADQIYIYEPTLTSTLNPLPLNDPSYNDSDPAVVDEDYIVFSSNRCLVDSSGNINPAGQRVTKLYVGQLGTAKYWLLDNDGVSSTPGNLDGANLTLTPATQ